MDKIITSFVGLDVHKDSIAMGVASDWLHPAASRKLGFQSFQNPLNLSGANSVYLTVWAMFLGSGASAGRSRRIRPLSRPPND